MNKKKGRWWISFVAGFSYFLDLIVHIFFSRNFGSLSLSFFFFASNGSGSARKEGDQKLTRSSLIFQRKSVQSFLADRDSYLACQDSTKPSYQHITRY
ncbi:hypothetical protein NC653_026904 [Populus alba x Populus x berolinensis]|uniref:Uncharacterized protein n=1 Tax=Populus alba x Populus x berolinensis TaxID=444605 RepID=A0AAD6M433_9ROSI|nr:hypothetical protein NC653_026904 [Populus alba x Populus x berolinensis]